MNTKDDIFTGIDVSKDTLDIYLNNKHNKIKNNIRIYGMLGKTGDEIIAKCRY